MCPVTLAVAAVGVGVAAYGASQQQAAQKSAAQSQQRMNSLSAARQRTQQIRESRAARANIEQKSANSGTAMSSSSQTGAAGVSAEAYGNIQYTGFEQQTGDALSKARQREADAQGIGSIGSSLVSMGGVMSQNKQEIQSIGDSIFG